MRFTLEISSEHPDKEYSWRRLRAAVRFLERVFGLKVVHVCEDAPGMAIDQRTSQESENQQNVL